MNTPIDIISQGTHGMIPHDEIKSMLESGKKLHIKLGADPTAPDLHLGHAVVLRKLRDFQQLGHHITFIIGDYTARIGDPTGKSKTRPPLSTETIAENTKTYLAQVGRILDTNNLTVRFNSEWLDPLTGREWLALCAKVTLARIIERDDFSKRLAEHQAIGFHELLYPLMQGYDSVALDCDIEIGGSDQTFNMLMGRFLQEQYGQRPQAVITMPLLEGLDGVQKMSKSLGNYIGLSESAQTAYGKIMSISDELMWRYYALLLRRSEQDIVVYRAMVESGEAHPMELKKALARDVVETFWSAQDAEHAQTAFEELFQKKSFSHAQPIALPAQQEISIVELIKYVGGATSSSEARRLVQGGGITLNNQKITDIHAQCALSAGATLKVGKHKFFVFE